MDFKIMIKINVYVEGLFWFVFFFKNKNKNKTTTTTALHKQEATKQTVPGIPAFFLCIFPYVQLLKCPFVCYGNLCHSVLYYTPNAQLVS